MVNTNNNKKNIVKVYINNIQIVDFISNFKNYSGPKKINRNHFYFNIKGSNNVNKKKNSIIITSTIEILYKNKIKSTLICQIIVAIEYKFENISKLIKTEGKTNKIPKDLLHKMLNTSFNTVRGILYEKLSGTNFENIYLPPIDTSNIVK